MMEREELGDLERKLSFGEESQGNHTNESDNAWQFKSVPEEESKKWKMEKERYEEMIEYIREVDDILNLIKPFPREGGSEQSDYRMVPPARGDSQIQSPRFGLDHLENMIKLVEQLKQLQENNIKSSDRTYYLKDLKKLREHKKRLKNEELEMRNRVRVRSITTPDEYELCLVNRKSSSTSEKLEQTPKENWQDKRKSICLGENRSKVSKWTKVKEAFHWEKTSTVPKTLKRENSLGERLSRDGGRDVSPDDAFALDVFCPPPSPPPPPPPPPPVSRPEHLLTVQPPQDFPSSSSSDRLDEFLTFSEVKERKTSDPDNPFGSDDLDEEIRRKSCDEIPQHLSKDEFGTSRSTKTNKTTWGKVKDIIQTRKDSLKKKPKKRGSDEFKKRRKLSTVSNPQFSDQFEDLSSPEDKVKSVNGEIIPKTVYDFPEEPSSPTVEEKCMRRLTPALTVTLPSTEELRSFSFDEADKRDIPEEEKSNVLNQFSCQAQYCEDKSKFGKGKSGPNQRLSRWIKVKRVFLTSATPVRSPQFLPVSSSSPTSQNKSSGFFSDLESDDLSSGEWIDDKSPSQEKQKLGFPEPQSAAMTIIQEDIRKSYNELQKKLSQEFDQKLREWEVKTEVPAKPDDPYPKIKGEDGNCIPKLRKTRESITVPLPSLNDLSPEFKKKLNDWKKMKMSQSSSSVSSSATKDEVQGQNIKIRIGEWQPWRNRTSGKGAGKGEQEFEDGQKGCGSSRPPANRRKDEEGFGTANRREEGRWGVLSGGQNLRPRIGVILCPPGRFRRTSDSHRQVPFKLPRMTSREYRRPILTPDLKKEGSKRRESVKKLTHSRTPSCGDSLISSTSTEKDGRFIRRSQKVKDFHWVEKELQKIEREKLRLEQEKEKYLEREARLEKMKRTMGTSPTQEILVRTPEGFIRFKGISQKFTKKLYEWEKARGIAPEASTFALLAESAKSGANGDPDADGVTIQRSKSTGSVPELSSALLIQTMSHQPSSLSLNDVDELKREEDESLSLEIKDGNEEPEAIIVDVEDIEEETAVLADSPPFQSETPIYTYTAEDMNRKTESRTRFYLSGGFDTKSSSGRETRKVLENDAEVFGSLEENDSTYREEKQHLSNSDSETIQRLSEGQENEKILMVEDSAKRFQVPENNRETFGDSFQCSGAQPCGYIKPKTKGIYDMKTENPETSDSLAQSSQRSFSQWMNKTENSRYTSVEKPDPQALKRKIKEKITLMQRISTEGSWKYSEVDFRKQNEKTKPEEDENSGRFENISKMEEQLFEGTPPHEKSGSISVFVPTTRKIISPVKTTDGATPSVCSYVIDDVKSDPQEKEIYKTSIPGKTAHEPTNSPPPQKKSDAEVIPKRDIGMPPLPNSPKTYKKLSPKEAAPSIRMIIAKYNQKISEHDNAEGKRTDSGSPIWRSPVFGRRTQEKIEKFCGKDEERRNGEVQKSASLDNMRGRLTNRSSLTPPQEQQIKGILKSSSVGVMRIRPLTQDPPDTTKETSPSALRAMRIQKAKEDFLSGRLEESSDASTTSTIDANHPNPDTKTPQQESETDQNLIKSVSAETITCEQGRSYPQAEEPDGRPLQKSSSKFDISSIKSKFRKIRMRKDKDPKLNAVAHLCRQSLFIEVPKTSDSPTMSKSCPSSPVMDRNKQENSPKK